MPDALAGLTPAVRRYLDAPRHATLATSAVDGMPHVSVVWYRLDGDAILVNSRVGRRWPRELQADARCALTVIHPDIDLELYVAIQAVAEVVATEAEALADIQALARRYGGDPATFVGQSRISFRLRPTSIVVHGELEPAVADVRA
ncbi:MAG TPA: pyridoxamine 5'-phosphate oxidase family protein [Candidatus Saccharimonadia bacterium]|nr:pyridoxamine 5'-phosphate oxidase family protein [Candidatus Saccharimonadia bacterium]